jgi:RND superfamily putative drug exporter
MTTFYAAFGRFVVRFRYPIIVSWVLLAIVSVMALPSLSSVIKTTQADFLPSNSPSLQAEKLAQHFNHQSSRLAPMTLVAVTTNRAFTPAQDAAITRLEATIRHLPNVKSVQDLSTSPDGRARQAQIEADVPQTGGAKDDALIGGIRSHFAHAPAGLTYHLTGDLIAGYDEQKASQNADSTAQMLSILVVIMLMLLAFRAVLAPVVTLMTTVMALMISGPAIALSTHLGVPVSSVTEAVLVVLLLGAGTDYCVFLLSRMREELGNGLAPKDAVARAIATVGESISFSAFTVIVALASLALAHYGIYRSLGLPLAISIGVMLVAGLTLLPALLSVFGRSVFWPARPKVVAVPRDGWWARVAGFCINRPWATLVTGVGIFVTLALGLVGAPTTGGFTSSVNSNTDSGRGQVALRAHFPTASENPEIAILTFRSSLWTNMAPAAAAQHRLAASGSFRSVVGPFGVGGFSPTAGFTVAQIQTLYQHFGPPLRLSPTAPAKGTVSASTYDAYRGLAQYISDDGKTVMYVTTPRNNNPNSPAALDAVRSLRATITHTAESVGATQSGLLGVLPVAYDVSQTSNSDLNRIIPIVAVLIAILLAIVLRSLVAPLYLVVSVLLSYLATLGLAGIIFVHLGSQSNLNFVLPLVVFMFLMALGSDYNILVMSRIREEAHSLPIAQAVKRAVGATGTSVTTAGLILGGTFAALGWSGADMQTKQIGYGIAAGILMDTFLVRTLLVPSIVVLIGRWNWWPSSLSEPESREEDESADERESRVVA